MAWTKPFTCSSRRFSKRAMSCLLPVPTYTMYEVYASATDARVVAVQAADDLQFPFERLLAAITPRTKIIADRQSQQPFRLRGHARAVAGTCAARAACGAAGR